MHQGHPDLVRLVESSRGTLPTEREEYRDQAAVGRRCQSDWEVLARETIVLFDRIKCT